MPGSVLGTKTKVYRLLCRWGGESRRDRWGYWRNPACTANGSTEWGRVGRRPSSARGGCAPAVRLPRPTFHRRFGPSGAVPSSAAPSWTPAPCCRADTCGHSPRGESETREPLTRSSPAGCPPPRPAVCSQDSRTAGRTLREPWLPAQAHTKGGQALTCWWAPASCSSKVVTRSRAARSRSRTCPR